MSRRTQTASSVTEISGVDLIIERDDRRLLDVSKIALGHFPCSVIIGPNGAGKSILVKSLCNLMTPDRGTVLWNTRPPSRDQRLRVGLLLQRPVLLGRSARENIVHALRASGETRGDARQLAEVALRDAGLDATSAVPARQLSGGEQQRLALARALSLNPDILFLDEATANVDPQSTAAIEAALRRSIDQGLKLVMVSHDLGQVRRMADEVIMMNHGKIAEQTQAAVFFDAPRSSAAKAMLSGELVI